MQITLNQDEIEEAIRNHVHGQVTIRESQKMSIDLRAGRGENGFTATLDVQPRPLEKAVRSGPPQLVAPVVEDQAPTTETEPEAPPEKATRAPRKNSKATKVANVATTTATAVTDTNDEETTPAPVPAKPSKKSIFGTSPKPVADSAETSGEADPDVPDQETPAEEAAREDATEATQDESQTEEDTPAEQPEAKKSIFAFGPKKTA